MAKRNVQSLLSKIIMESDKTNSASGKIRRLINKRTHYYDLSLENLIYEVSEEVKGTFGKVGIAQLSIDKSQQAIIDRACLKYFNSVKATMTKSSGVFKVDVLTNTDTSFSVKITSPKLSDNFENFLNSNRKGPLSTLQNDLKSELKPTYKEDVGDRLNRVLDPGHKVGSSIAEQRTKLYIKSMDAKIKNFKTKLPVGIKYEDSPMYRLEMAINSNDRVNEVKQTISITDVYVTEQGRGSNYKQSIEEAKLLASIRRDIKNALLDQDWVNFESSTSPIGRAENILLDSLKKAGAKVKTNNKKTVQPSGKKVSMTIKGKSKNTSSSEKISSISAEVGGTRLAQRNWLSLLPIINAKLVPRVMGNMRKPALVNRTGNFANSAQVVNVEQTREGFPSFVFDYERNPYDVFDRTKGRSPWNTPERDPRALVDKSLREIVREMAIGRFYTRRA